MQNRVKLQYYHIFLLSILKKLVLVNFRFLSLPSWKSSKSCLTFLVYISISVPYVLQERLILIKSNLQICKFWKWLIFDKQRHCKPFVTQGKCLILMSFTHSMYTIHIATVKPDIKICWFYVKPKSVFF